jgi:hypothetical protein
MKKVNLLFVLLFSLFAATTFAQDATLQWRVGDDSGTVGGNHEGSLYLPYGTGGNTSYQRKWNNVSIDGQWDSGQVPVVFAVDANTGGVYSGIDGWSETGFYGFNHNIAAVQLDVAADNTPHASFSGLNITSVVWSGDDVEDVESEVDSPAVSGGPECSGWRTEVVENPDPSLYTRCEIRGTLQITSEGYEDCPYEDALWGSISMWLE